MKLTGHDVNFELLPGEIILIGRGEVCDLRLNDASVSRVHCRLTVHRQGVTLSDVNSRWGTIVQEKKVSSYELRVGDRFTIGETTLTLESGSAAQSTTIVPNHKSTGSERQPRQDLTSPTDPSHESLLPVAQTPSRPRQEGVSPVLRASEFLGQRFGRYLLESELGRSSSGIVFQALEPASGTSFAVKLFHPQVTASPAVQQRIVRATQTMSKVRHPNLVTLHEAGEHAGVCYLVSELVEGTSVAAVLADCGIVGMLDPQIVLRILLDVANGLECAEEHGIVHRNITPQNILLTRDHRAKLNDLVLARGLESSESERITQPGEVLGNVAYLSPESLTGEGAMDHRSDIYQLGATGYALLTGMPPFTGSTPLEIITAISSRELLPPSRFQLSIPPLLEGVVMRMLSRHPARRHATVRDLRRDLERVQKYL